MFVRKLNDNRKGTCKTHCLFAIRLKGTQKGDLDGKTPHNVNRFDVTHNR